MFQISLCSFLCIKAGDVCISGTIFFSFQSLQDRYTQIQGLASRQVEYLVAVGKGLFSGLIYFSRGGLTYIGDK